MSKPCSVCVDTRRDAVDQALVAGIAVDEISRRYPPLSATSLRRHRAEHLPATLAKSEAAKAETHADDLLEQVQQLKRKAVSLLLKAEAAGDYRTALAGIREARSCLELLLEVEGEIDRRPVVNILVSDEWLRVRTTIIGALETYPEAKRAVVGALSASGGSS